VPSMRSIWLMSEVGKEKRGTCPTHEARLLEYDPVDNVASGDFIGRAICNG